MQVDMDTYISIMWPKTMLGLPGILHAPSGKCYIIGTSVTLVVTFTVF